MSATRTITRDVWGLTDSPVIGVIWRWDHSEDLTRREADYWDLHVLPFGWSIISDSRRRGASSGGENVRDDGVGSQP